MSTDRRWMAFAVLASLFLSGVAVGGVGVMLLRGPDRPDRTFDAPALRDRPFPGAPLGGDRGDGGPPAGPRAFAPERTVRRLADELELSAAQRDSVAAILRRQREAARETLADMAPRLRASVDSAAAQIGRLLTPEQRARFEEMELGPGPFRGPPFQGSGPGSPP